MRLRRLRRWWPLGLVAFVALFVYAAWPGNSTFTISTETTYITEPLDADGYVDYQAAVNERLGAGVSPKKNASVLLWQAIGPHPEGGTMPPEYFRWLGVESPPEDGDYFIDSDKYFDKYLKDRAEPLPAEPDDQPKPKQPDPPGVAGADEFWEFRPPPDRKKKWDDQLERARKWPWKTKEHPDIADWLKQNAKPLALAIEASQRPQYFHPLVAKASTGPGESKMLGSLLPNVQKTRGLVLGLKYRAMSRVADGDFDGAWQDLMACQRLGRLMMQCSTLIEHLVGLAIVAIATDGQILLLSHSKHSSKQMLAWLNDVRELPPFPPLADKFDLGERFFGLDALMSAIRHQGRQMGAIIDARRPNDMPGVRFWDRLFARSIDWDQALRNFNQMYDRCAAASRMTDREARHLEFEKLIEEVTQKKSAAVSLGMLDRASLSKSERGEMIGDMLIGLMVPAVEKIQDANDRNVQSQLNLHVAFALAAFRADTGRYPATLDELAPKYLPTIPADIFSGKPLIYRPTENGYLLYSVGVNGIDEDGRWTDDDPKGDDLRVRMPLPEPARKDNAEPKADCP